MCVFFFLFFFFSIEIDNDNFYNKINKDNNSNNLITMASPSNEHPCKPHFI